MSNADLNDRVLVAEDTVKSLRRRVTATLGGGRSVTFAGGDGTLDSLIENLEWLVGQLRDCRKRNLRLSTALRMLRDMAGA